MAEEDNQTEPQQQEPAAVEPSVTEPDAQTGQHAEPKAPWERDGETFDPEKAWKLIQNLREEKEQLSTRNRALEDEKLTKQQRMERDLNEANEKIKAYETRTAWAEAKAAHPLLSDDDLNFIGAGSPEEIKDKAAKLAARLEAQAAANPVNQTEPNASNPMLRPQPTGGNDPTTGDGGNDWLRSALNEN